MKRYSCILVALFLISFIKLNAQNEIDALRYSQTYPLGTAKSIGMGGAIGAIGGDFTSLSINPAGIGLYRSSELTFSPSLYFNSTTSSFLGETNVDDVYQFNLGNLGMVFNKNTGNESGWISTSFGFGYNRINNLSQDIFMKGTNLESSFLDNFVDYANNYSELDPYYEQLAYDVYLLPYDTVYNEYWNDIQNAGYGQEQQRYVSKRGSMGEYVFSLGANYNNKLYVGATLGITKMKYEEIMLHTESDPANFIDFFDSFDFEEYLITNGVGYSFKLGIIGRPLSMLRIGAAFHLPTFYYINESYENTMTGYYDASEGLSPETSSSGMTGNDYRLRTPFKAIGSAALILGKMGMISVDYEYVDYSKANLEAPGVFYNEENSTINNLYRNTSNIRIGGELKLGGLYLRGGYALYSSPFATSEPNVDADRNVLSAGIGFRGKNAFMDLAYSHSNEQIRYYMYVPQMVDGSLNTQKADIAQLTVGFKF